MKKGLIVGKFLPMHKGHIYIIEESAKKVDQLFVIVDEHPSKDKKYCEEAGFPYMNLETRYKIVKENIANLNNIKILKLSEKGIPEFPNGWEEWSKKVIQTLGFTPDFIFTSDLSYLPKFSKYFKSTLPVIIDANRDHFHISSTRVRANWKKEINYLPNNVKEFIRNNYEK